MACAASLELQMALFITKKRAMDMHVGLQPWLSPEEFADFGNAQRRKTFPKLITSLCKAFKLSKELIEALSVAKQGRDYLAHNFWHANLGFLHSDRGVDLIVEQCSNDAWHFREVTTRLEQEIGFDVHDFVEATAASASVKVDEFEAILAKYR